MSGPVAASPESWAAWGEPSGAVHVEPLRTVARRVAQSAAWRAWVWAPDVAGWRPWWEVPSLVAAVAEEFPPPAPAAGGAQPGAGPAAAGGATRPSATPFAARPPVGTELAVTIRPSSPDETVEAFLRAAAQRQPKGAVRRLDRELDRRRGDWRAISALGWFGYSVAADVGLSTPERREILLDFLGCELPSLLDGREEWHQPGTYARLDKVIGFLEAHNIENARKNPNGSQDAIDKWTDDVAWLRTEFCRG